jgi:hypothetical protein
MTTNTMSTAQIINSIPLTGSNSTQTAANQAAAASILNNAQVAGAAGTAGTAGLPNGGTLQGVGLAALGMLIQNENGANVAGAYGMSPPVSSGASGWTIGIRQLDFSANATNAANLLSAALFADNPTLFPTASTAPIASAFT